MANKFLTRNRPNGEQEKEHYISLEETSLESGIL